jgi:hypothetical protein
MGLLKNLNLVPSEALGTSLVNLRFLETELGKQLYMGWNERNRNGVKIV